MMTIIAIARIIDAEESIEFVLGKIPFFAHLLELK
jgi:hypothetical protein